MVTSNRSAVSTAFNRFLYAGVGDDANGMELTLLSAFARQNVDPWQQAADLSRLPGEAAIRALATLLDALPGQGSLLQRTALAERLILLLPQPSETRRRDTPPSLRPSLRATDARRNGHTTGLAMVLIYFAAMLVGAWWFGSHAPMQDAAQPDTARVAGGSDTPASIEGGPGKPGPRLSPE
jgi:hypothetical protein